MGPPKAESAGPRAARQNRTEFLTCSTLELPPRDVGEGRTRTDNHARLKRSIPDLTTWKIGARRRWSEAERRTRRCGARLRSKRVNRTGTGNCDQRGLSPPGLHSNHAARKWCGHPLVARARRVGQIKPRLRSLGVRRLLSHPSSVTAGEWVEPAGAAKRNGAPAGAGQGPERSESIAPAPCGLKVRGAEY